MRREVVIWHWASTGDGFPEYDLYGRMLDADGKPAGNTFTIQETAGNQQNATVAYGSDNRYQLAWQDDREGEWDLYTAFLDPDYQYVTIQYEYDPLYRLTNADYSGDFNGEFTYAYDGVGNRMAYTTSITSTTVVTYQYDLANRLTESVADGITTTTYTWDNMSRLITTTIGAQVSRIYQFSQDGDLTLANVNGLTTTFSYDGMGNRLLMSVAGEVTTYTVDYAGNSGRVLFEEGSETKHYLYGYACLGEVVDTGTVNEEIRYYHRDGTSMVRQTSNAEARISLAWTFTPEGMVLIGEEGPVTHLDCGADAVYDRSTGLIFKNGGYFDPTLGIWITLMPFVVWNHNKQKKKKRGRNKISLLLLMFIFIALICSGCTNTDSDCPPNPPTPTPILPLTIDVGFILVNGTTMTNSDIESQIGIANSKLAQADVTIRNDGVVELDSMDPSRPNLSEELIGADLEVNILPSVNEQDKLFEWNIANSQATVFYVKSIFPIELGWTDGPNVLISNLAEDRTLPHEIGHVFGLEHPTPHNFNQDSVNYFL